MISKQARAFVRGWLLGLSKQAAPIQPAAKPAQPLAYVGNHHARNTYLRQLKNNYIKAGGNKAIANAIIGNSSWQFGPRAFDREDHPVLQSDLTHNRPLNAAVTASELFETNTKQFNAYKDWLIRRGAENQNFFHKNVLQHDPKSSIPLPPILQQEPADIQKKMNIEGKGMAHNNSYNKFKNGIPS
jgi:hypothetical protein